MRSPPPSLPPSGSLGRRSAILRITELFLALPAALSFGASAGGALGITAAGAGRSSTLSMSSSSDGVAVVGCGVLGTSLCRQLVENSHFGSRTVVGITKTPSRHEQIRSAVVGQAADDDRLQLLLVTSDDFASQQDSSKFKDVVFCAPPSGFDDYPAAVQSAIEDYWDRDLGGCFVFTSSGGIYGQGSDGETVTETSPTADPATNPRTAKLVGAETACREGGGCVLRLAGLYTLERGAHNYWLESGKDIQGRADGIINLLHYDDAASACMAAIEAGPTAVAGKTFLISDSRPTTRLGICESAIKAAKYAGKTIPPIVGGSDMPRGKIYDGSWSDATLSWKPKYESFDKFMASQS